MTPVHLTIIALVSGLVFPAIASYEAVYPAMAAMLIGVMVLPRLAGEFAGSPAFRLLVGAGVLLTLAMAFSWNSADDLVLILVLIPIFLAPGLAALLRHTRYDLPEMAGGLALAGSLAAAGFGLFDILNGIPRAGVGNNPIHYASLATVLGFFALIGLFSSRRWGRFLVLLGPVSALASVLMSGSRGPLLAVLVLGAILAPLMLRHFWREKVFRFAVLAAVASALVLLVGELTAQSGSHNLVGTVLALADGNGLDASSHIRATFWQSGWAAFWEQPWFGHGASHIYSAAAAHFPAGFAAQYNVHQVHLHADLLDFAVAGGALGLVALVLVLVAPFALLSGQTDPERRAVLLTGALVLGPGYLVLGLTNATIGILPQTGLFGVGLGVLMALARPSRPT